MLRKLVKKFSQVREMPIEVSEVAHALIELGAQDSIIFSDEDTDPGKVRGVLYQYTTSSGVYSSPDLVTLIVYSKNTSIEWQRIICCKELIHLCDLEYQRTNTEEEVSDLLEKLIGPMSTEDFGYADMVAAVDKLAFYKAVGILFPDAARSAAIELIKVDKSVEEIAKMVCLPIDLVKLVLGDEWPETHTALCSI